MRVGEPERPGGNGAEGRGCRAQLELISDASMNRIEALLNPGGARRGKWMGKEGKWQVQPAIPSTTTAQENQISETIFFLEPGCSDGRAPHIVRSEDYEVSAPLFLERTRHRECTSELPLRTRRIQLGCRLQPKSNLSPKADEQH